MQSPTPIQIREKRKKGGILQKEAAQLLEVGYSTFQHWEEGIHKMHPLLWRVFCEKIDYLINNKKEI